MFESCDDVINFLSQLAIAKNKLAIRGFFLLLTQEKIFSDAITHCFYREQIKERNPEGNNILHIACQFGDTDSLNYLLNVLKGRELIELMHEKNHQNLIPFDTCAQEYRDAMQSRLLQYCSPTLYAYTLDIDKREPSENTIFDYAIKEKRLDIMEMTAAVFGHPKAIDIARDNIQQIASMMIPPLLEVEHLENLMKELKDVYTFNVTFEAKIFALNFKTMPVYELRFHEVLSHLILRSQQEAEQLNRLSFDAVRRDALDCRNQKIFSIISSLLKKGFNPNKPLRNSKKKEFPQAYNLLKYAINTSYKSGYMCSYQFLIDALIDAGHSLADIDCDTSRIFNFFNSTPTIVTEKNYKNLSREAEYLRVFHQILRKDSPHHARAIVEVLVRAIHDKSILHLHESHISYRESLQLENVFVPLFRHIIKLQDSVWNCLWWYKVASAVLRAIRPLKSSIYPEYFTFSEGHIKVLIELSSLALLNGQEELLKDIFDFILNNQAMDRFLSSCDKKTKESIFKLVNSGYWDIIQTRHFQQYMRPYESSGNEPLVQAPLIVPQSRDTKSSLIERATTKETTAERLKRCLTALIDREASLYPTIVDEEIAAQKEDREFCLLHQEELTQIFITQYANNLVILRKGLDNNTELGKIFAVNHRMNSKFFTQASESTRAIENAIKRYDKSQKPAHSVQNRVLIDPPTSPQDIELQPIETFKPPVVEAVSEIRIEDFPSVPKTSLDIEGAIVKAETTKKTVQISRHAYS
jgi:hypothetical protein